MVTLKLLLFRGPIRAHRWVRPGDNIGVIEITVIPIKLRGVTEREKEREKERGERERERGRGRREGER